MKVHVRKQTRNGLIAFHDAVDPVKNAIGVHDDSRVEVHVVGSHSAVDPIWIERELATIRVLIPRH